MTELQIARLINALLSTSGLVPLVIVLFDLINIFRKQVDPGKKRTALLLIAIVLSICVYFIITAVTFWLTFGGVVLSLMTHNLRHVVMNIAFNVVGWGFFLFEKAIRPKLFNGKPKAK